MTKLVTWLSSIFLHTASSKLWMLCSVRVKKCLDKTKQLIGFFLTVYENIYNELFWRREKFSPRLNIFKILLHSLMHTLLLCTNFCMILLVFQFKMSIQFVLKIVPQVKDHLIYFCFAKRCIPCHSLSFNFTRNYEFCSLRLPYICT